MVALSSVDRFYCSVVFVTIDPIPTEVPSEASAAMVIGFWGVFPLRREERDQTGLNEGFFVLEECSNVLGGNLDHEMAFDP